MKPKGLKHMRNILIITVCYVYLASLASAFGEDDLEYKTVIKQVDGIKFEVVEDRPIEKKDGIIAPMPMDKYVAMKCSKINKSIASLEESLNNIKLKLESDIKPKLIELENRLKNIETFTSKLDPSTAAE